MYKVRSSKAFRRALKQLARSSLADVSCVQNVVALLSNGNPLPRMYLDHQLSGNLKGYRECHVKNDLLLVYEIQEGMLILVLIDLGTHASLFR